MRILPVRERKKADFGVLIMIHKRVTGVSIGSVLYPRVNCTGIRTLNPGFRGSPLTHGYKTDPIMIHKRVTGLLC